MGKKYNNSPIVEAVCEFRFQPGTLWQPDYLNQIAEQLKGLFPKKRMAQAFEASFQLSHKVTNRI